MIHSYAQQSLANSTQSNYAVPYRLPDQQDGSYLLEVRQVVAYKLHLSRFDPSLVLYVIVFPVTSSAQAF